MNSRLGETESKWTCEYCTYENWPSSLKCTMCRGAKPLLGEDIYRLRDPSPQRSGSNVASGPVPPASDSYNLSSQNYSQNVPSAGKWYCETCTYLNYQNATRCTQCSNRRSPTTTVTATTPQHNQSINSVASNLHEHLAPLRLGDPPPPSLPSTNSQCNTPSANLNLNPDRCPSSNNSGQQQPEKWSCQACTYENWPKSGKCVMCGHQRERERGRGEKGSNSQNTSSLILPSPERDLHHNHPQRGLPSPPHTPYIHQAQRDENLAIARRSSHRYDGRNDSLPTPQSPNNCDYERRLKQLRRHTDWCWLNACLGIVEGDNAPVEAYLASGGDPARQLTHSEVLLLNRSSAFDIGHTLVHLAIRFQREDILATLLSQIEGSGSGIKRVPSYVAPDLAVQIRRHVSNSIRMRKGSFPCYFVTDMATFALPAEVEDLPSIVQEQMLEELLDREAQQQLEGGGGEPPALNWSLEITDRLGSRLHALWNRSAGDCLLDSVMQATWGVFDRDNSLRRALADTLQQAGQFFYPRWREYEASQASRMLDFTLEETQWQEDWENLLTTAAQPGSALEQLHVFALAHILRRPIIVYGVKYVKSFRGEDIGYARFEGVYLPLLWEPSFCIRSPIALGYTRGHFTALVPIEPYSSSRIPALASHHGGVNVVGGGNSPMQQLQMQTTFMPLMDRDRKLLPIHFLSPDEMGREETILKQWLDVCTTEGGILVAQQKLHKRPLLVAQMVEEWLNHYRRLAQMNEPPFSRAIALQDYSSDGDTEDE
ncbi:ubiquitin thioesterase trabid isoform X1 [Nasonia vitripennis]|uniref:ubiquitinyl hydrolase 1 n=2 Tax=Nasonia vitripennis TaxID=7425 RepID=A0A7M7GCW7_NASVI|nr:ubiquitin thioesterase trabid isoform X1 [Nasonia vitripennis]XP_008206913.1 ubiquitin thioesterase trabid isoform X1 [Nasonia vitripennis]XP_008206914.1 ubiquitin thioesterase trabid isoform X1 [Nasonia vitripennis]XP_016841163.1 ubiquitin thioesterase trabid isoform X1 [Nasonia vitripennis]XP_016841164.1 ubiquitin thioesterase trabid isoform X1 [Nasonia vitripennis]